MGRDPIEILRLASGLWYTERRDLITALYILFRVGPSALPCQPSLHHIVLVGLSSISTKNCYDDAFAGCCAWSGTWRRYCGWHSEVFGRSC